MANLVTTRNALATSLRAAGRVVFAYPAENITPPALVLVPGSPYLTPQVIGGANNRVNIKFDLTAIVNAADNQAALANLETLMLATFTALPMGVTIGSWSQPTVTQVGNADMLISQVSIELATTTE
jgi:hypothetical protein